MITWHEIGDRMRDRTAKVTQYHPADLLHYLGHYAWVKQPNVQTQFINICLIINVEYLDFL
jgi:Cu2+-exporting ATPase